MPKNLCSVCKKREATQLCDYISEHIWTSNHGHMPITCDKPLCKECSIRMGGGYDFCPQHRQELLKQILISDK